MTRMLIIGAGPAGIRAAETLVAVGLRPQIVDEGERAGGQIYRRPPPGFTRPPRALYGSEADKAAALHRTFDGLVRDGQVDHHPRATVFALSDGVAHIVQEGTVRRIAYDRLILATGASDRLAPVPGWQAPGVYSLGAMQIALKAQGVALGRELVLAGSGPLLTLVAHQLRKAGANVAAVLDTAPLSSQAAGGAQMALARPRVTLRGLAVRAGLGRLYHPGATLERIEADADGPTALHWRDAAGRARVSSCDAVALGWHLRAETHLADLAGARFEWSPIWHQWLPVTDAMGRAGDGLYLAGDGLRLLGADGAEIAGRLAATACLRDMSLPAPNPGKDLRQLARMAWFAKGVARAFPWPADMVRNLPGETMLCRCEGVTVADARSALALAGPEANRLKALARVGMGRCQGRYCQLAGAEIVADETRRAPCETGRLRAQPPVRPVPVSAFLQADPDI
ncbi:NADPH-dependent 2,4-dienoyl-CoA reductase/sulfur reductase-like enzyme [Breoghania corrubedonensis]|uniref:NADPH-dependent 2,4-dienoyl-CoA reductase/sulfur reductase-like enzyme n=1 Tax=Breoghania corrubedonensis TaxID=665038 RepID=A0A2T5VGN4_9HYPH|nr:FAD/NAD(P)-binding oxidoreductase [Breoghania corrubedonensis]PTW62914.1 NADPH-dependent 2,4-dienoyl-CoA reductase/sulfur reductase-like enzyme [Breoghania corrubedonensis]